MGYFADLIVSLSNPAIMNSSVAIYQAQPGLKNNAYGMVSPACCVCCVNVKHFKIIDENFYFKSDFQK
jgi:hypothetical protein